MTPDEQNHIAATLAAHENVLAILLSFHLKRLSPEQRDLMTEAMTGSLDMGIMPKGVNLDLDSADELAGLALKYRDAVNRLYSIALARAEDWDK